MNKHPPAKRVDAQPVKEPQLSESESWGFPVIWMVTNKYQCENGALPTPLCQLFQIHGSIFKPHPSRNPGQTSVVCVTHGVFLFCICKNPLNGLLFAGHKSACPSRSFECSPQCPGIPARCGWCIPFAPLYSHRILLCKGNFCTTPVCFGTFGCPSGR